jgi:hypothetical protein
LSSSLEACGGGVHTFYNVLLSPSSDFAKESVALKKLKLFREYSEESPVLQINLYRGLAS